MKTQKKLSTKKMLVTALLAALAYVLNSFVYFPSMAPFQHFVDVLAAVLVGPWYGFASALICGILRMMSGRTIQAVTALFLAPFLAV
ncbi:energy coupling factor transporter S component ThiW [Fructobacillus cardui]|uniref:energy coupling factor transporter S component ThiW n=1 Tax=Fructobacillus cardui TaxID=2893170 RepID=UPI002228775E|nr:energy coupling factor transporter S component ThiW [Fructobacillus cardui]